MKIKTFFLCFVAMLAVAGCGNIESEARYPTGAERAATGGDIYAKPESIFGEGGIRLLGRDRPAADDSGIGVNSYLWRASLDTVSFMPLASVDPFGGVILTDWYAPEDTPGERFKVDVFIMGRQLRSDGVRVRVFRQVRRSGSWQDAAASDETARQLEDAILTRARQLRVASGGR